MRKYTKAITLIELMIVVIIIGILASLAVAVPRGQIERAKSAEGETQIKLIWAAEKDYYIYNGRYTDEWTKLNMDNPTPGSKYFIYSIVPSPLLIKAARKDGSEGLQINADGVISKF
ncbi:MAG: prepilin-type N-terminal cleavage/methylation domain-containing protein [Candidatus Omnitrophota bacterium]